MEFEQNPQESRRDILRERRRHFVEVLQTFFLWEIASCYNQFPKVFESSEQPCARRWRGLLQTSDGGGLSPDLPESGSDGVQGDEAVR